MATRKINKRHYYQPSLGVRTDFEKLLQQFSALGTVRYEKFAEIFREMKLSLFCAGRQTQREAREYVEECLEIAVQFWMPPSSFLVRVGALYLLYGLYFFQLASPRVKIRLTQEQWKMASDFHREAREQQHLDLEYIFQKLQVHKAFNFVATVQELYPTFREKEEHHIIPDNLKEETSAVDEIFSDAAVNQLELVHDQYQKMKTALNGEDASKPDPSLDVIHSDLLNAINKTLQTHRSRQKSTKYMKELVDPNMAEDEMEDMDMDQPSTSVKKTLKRKAFSTTLGYYKSRKKGVEASSEDTAGSATDDTRSPEKKLVLKKDRGREAAVDLYEKDEADSGPVMADLSGVFNMPDIDSIIPAKFKETENAEASTSKKMTHKSKKRNSTADGDFSHEEDTLEAHDGYNAKPGTSADFSPKKKLIKSESDSDSYSPMEHDVKGEVSFESESEVGTGSRPMKAKKQTAKAGKLTAKGGKQKAKTGKQTVKTGKQSIKAGKQSVKAGKQTTKAGKQSVKAGKQPKTLKVAVKMKAGRKLSGKSEQKLLMEKETIDESPRKKIPTAQEILHQSLITRRKLEKQQRKKMRKKQARN